MYFPTASVDLGLDFGRHWGFRLYSTSDERLEISYLLPTLEVRVLFAGKLQSEPVLALGSSLVGLRIAEFPFAVDLRFPRIDTWTLASTRSSSVGSSLGGSVVGSFAF
jgi:hypothetical protein